MKSTKYADIGVFGGSGFYNFLSIRDEIRIKTPYGLPQIKL
jgi:purine nucleoside phosphorylase